MTDRHDGGSGPGWVDAPDLPDASQWSRPLTRDDQAPVPGWRRRGAPPPPSRWSRVLRWWPLAMLAAVLLVLAGIALRFGDTSAPLLPRDASVQALYLAEEGELLEAAFVRDGSAVGADRELHDQLWGEWSSMIPPYWSRRVTRFEVASDGPGGIAAAVQRLDEAGDRWLLSVDPVDAVERRDDYVHTLVHELAHIVTLGAGRVEVDATPAATLVEQAARCDGPPVTEGCAAAGSVLAGFSERYWDLAAVGGPDGVATIGDREDATIERYLAAPDSYVSAYAASSPGEDIAETFTAMALDTRQPPGSPAAEKVEFLRADAELFALADRIRATLRGN